MSKNKSQNNSSISIKNRKAEFEYFLLTTFTAGIVLCGTEIKSIRAGKVNLTDSYCSFENEELWVHNLHISEYANGSYNNHEPKRDRKLLLTRKELKKLQAKLNACGLTRTAMPNSTLPWRVGRRCTTSAKASKKRTTAARPCATKRTKARIFCDNKTKVAVSLPIENQDNLTY